MTELVHYPVSDYGPAMKGLVIGGVGIVHVFLAQFAIGGGMVLTYFEWLKQKRASELAGTFVDSYFRALVLISFVAGAVTGVGMWFTTIQVSPRTIGVMVEEFHWVWAIEWTFFALEVAAGYTFYRCGHRLRATTRMALLVTYSAAAWFSLFWINGILSWQLTPGSWQPGAVWTGFFNASFWPSLAYRTVVALTIATLVACLVVNTMTTLERAHKKTLIGHLSRLLLPMVLLPFIGAWYLAVIPVDSRGWIMGGSPAMSMFAAIAVGSSALVGGYAVLGLIRGKLFINGATAGLLVALSFGATAGGEFVREGIRKPFTVRNLLYSNSIRADEVARLRMVGSVSDDPYPLRDQSDYPSADLILGAKVYRAQCSVCHTVRGANGLTHLAGGWSIEQLRLNIAKLQRTKAFMPPFAGSPAELDALCRYIFWESRARNEETPAATAADLKQIATWLLEAGPQAAQVEAH